MKHFPQTHQDSGNGQERSSITFLRLDLDSERLLLTTSLAADGIEGLYLRWRPPPYALL
jgi:hypothetical protein